MFFQTLLDDVLFVPKNLNTENVDFGANSSSMYHSKKLSVRCEINFFLTCTCSDGKPICSTQTLTLGPYLTLKRWIGRESSPYSVFPGSIYIYMAHPKHKIFNVDSCYLRTGQLGYQTASAEIGAQQHRMGAAVPVGFQTTNLANSQISQMSQSILFPCKPNAALKPTNLLLLPQRTQFRRHKPKSQASRSRK